jgi:hypothetical protein
MRAFPLAATAAAALALTCGCAAPAAAHSGPSAAFRISDPRIGESSGLIASRSHPGIYWTHNDSGDGPYVYAVDSATGKTVAKVTMRGVHARDVEAISIGPDGDLYLGDIGDNLNGSWPQVYVYRFPEPEQLRDQSVDVTRYTVRYSDGPRDAEALMVQPRTGRLYIASKNEDGGHLYQGPAKLSAHGVNVFTPIGDVPWVTDGSFSPDGSRLVLRGYFWATEYRWADDRPRKIGSVTVPMQPQGESVAFTPDGTALMYGSEGADSQVWKVPLSGQDLPDSAGGTAASGGAGQDAAGRDAPAASGTATPSTAPTSTTSTNKAGGKALGIFILAGIFGLAYWLRRVLRRRPRD